MPKIFMLLHVYSIMKILINKCALRDMLFEFLGQGFEVKCLSEASSDFISHSEFFVAAGWKDIEKNINRMKNLRMIQTLSAGVDHIRFEKLPSNIIVCSNSGANAVGVAELAMTHILVALKMYVKRHNRMREGEFPQMIESRLLRGKTVGIIGFGNVGAALAHMLRCFSTKILAVNRHGDNHGIPVDFIGTMDSLDYLLKNSDIVVLTLPLTRETEGLITREKLRKMKRKSILVNVGRGKTIVEKDLYEHLIENPEFIAALDAWWHYGDKFKQRYPFHRLPNVLMSPHCGGVYKGFWEDLVRFAAQNIKLFLQGQPRNVVHREDYLPMNSRGNSKF